MKIRIDRNELTEALSSVSGATGGRLSHSGQCKLEVSCDGCEVTATDLDLTLSRRVGCESEEAGGFVVEHRVLLGMCKAMNSEYVEIELNGESAEVLGGGARYRLAVLGVDDYPDGFPEDAELSRVSLPCEVLSGALRGVVYAADRDAPLSRPQFGGVSMEIGNGEAVFVATDGRRLAEYVWRGDVSGDARCVLSGKGSRALCGVLPDGSESCAVVIGERGATIESGCLRARVSLLAGQYPDYKRVIPCGHCERVTMDAATIRDVLKRAAVVAGDDAAVVLELSDGGMRVESRSVYGVFDERLKIGSCGAARVSLSLRYLLEALPCGGDVEMHLRGSDAPLVLLFGGDTRAVIMPRREA